MSENNFPRAGFFTRGYEPSQVDEFFADARKAYEGGVPAEKFSAAQVRGAHFDLVRRGYQTAAIDQAMDRLEAAFVRRDRADNVPAGQVVHPPGWRHSLYRPGERNVCPADGASADKG